MYMYLYMNSFIIARTGCFGRAVVIVTLKCFFLIKIIPVQMLLKSTLKFKKNQGGGVTWYIYLLIYFVY